ncbi:hypothetical protein AVEN_184833-1, partial [Araneus ventricosus]
EKEEHLLPPPYQTNCRDNGPSDDVENFTNPNSYQVCLEMCKLEFSKEMFGCDHGMTMQLSTNNLCYRVLGFSRRIRRWRKGRELFLISRVANSKAGRTFRKASASEAGIPTLISI